MSAPFPDPVQPTKFTREVSDISLATSPASSSTLADFEGLPPVPPITKSPSRLSVFSWFASIVHRHPFLFAAFLYAVLTGFVASVAKSSYDRDKRDADVRFGHVGDGVSFSSVSLALVGFELMWHIIACDPWNWLSDRYHQQNALNLMEGRGVWNICTSLLLRSLSVRSNQGMHHVRPRGGCIFQ